MDKTAGNLEIVSSKAGMDAKTARKYRRLQRLPSELAMKPRGMRPDPFADIWAEVREQLEVSAGLEARTLFEYLQRRYPGRFQDGQLTDPVERSVITREQILALLAAIEDMHDLSLMYIGIFCGLRASEAMGLQWKSWTGEALMPHGTAYEGQFYKGRLKSKASKAPIPVPEQVRPIIEAWRRICKDSSPEALMFPTFGRGERKGQAVPRDGKNFLRCRIRPVARKLGIPNRLVTFQVMRRTMGTDMQHHGTLKDTQGALRHASIRTTGDVYVQPVDESVVRAVNSRTAAVLGGWKAPVEKLGLKGRNLRSVPVEEQGRSAI